MKSVQEFATASPEAMRQALEALAARCSSPNWDGEGAVLIGRDTVDRTAALLREIERMTAGKTLREDVELEVVPEPDGDVGIDWFLDNDHVLDISVGHDGSYYFAFRFGDERRTGRSPVALGVPLDLIGLIRRFYA